MKKSTYIVIGIIVIILVVVLIRNSKSKIATGGEPIQIGGVFGLTGDAAAWGEAAKNGAELAVKDINARGGVLGRPLQLDVEDMRSSSEGSISAVSKLISTNGVKAIVGPTWLDSYQGAATLVKDNNVVLISSDAGIEAVNGDAIHRNAFSTWYRTDVKARIIVDYMASHGVKKLAQVYQNDPYYTDFAARVEKYSKIDGIQIVSTELVNSGVADMRTQTLKLKSSGADAVIFALYDEKSVISFLQTKHNILPALPMYGDEFVHDHYAVPEYEGLYDGTIYFYAAEPRADFVTEYKNAYNTDPVFGAATAYDAVMVIADMFTHKGLDADYNFYLRSTTFDSAAYGKFTFDALGGVQTANNQFDLFKVTNNVATKIN